VATVARELDLARRRHGLSRREIGRAVGLSEAQVGRIARGLAPSLTIVQASRLLAAVGLELSVRAFPAGDPIRDVAHLVLLEKLRVRLHRSIRWRAEVPLPLPGDLRACDAVLFGSGWALPVEAETRLIDLQALDRRIALKQRDGRMNDVLLLCSDTRNNRAALRVGGAALSDRYPLPGRRALELLTAGHPPEGGSIILL
jgi:transcriptional regulator with XRE-family HTH domain